MFAPTHTAASCHHRDVPRQDRAPVAQLKLAAPTRLEVLAPSLERVVVTRLVIARRLLRCAR
jgi:hypothetical protein